MITKENLRLELMENSPEFGGHWDQKNTRFFDLHDQMKPGQYFVIKDKIPGEKQPSEFTIVRSDDFLVVSAPTCAVIVSKVSIERHFKYIPPNFEDRQRAAIGPKYLKEAPTSN